ncbi:cobalamin biosynthesis protein [Thalassospira sp. MCCC 1A02803]|nr:threonine-phosphate decarboxylase [Thalassospira sp. MCCC 1A02898]ONH85755.1 cobalamin biosynthesis protein [Thalassospira sp. MCCC 1A02803]
MQTTDSSLSIRLGPIMTNSHITPKKQPPINHGGAVDRAANRYGIPTSDWLDLSTGINPIAYPVPDIENAHWQRLPLTAELDGLKAAAKQYYTLPTTDHLICAPGTQALIQMIPFWLKDRMADQATKNVHVMGPTYGEHERCWRRAGYHCQTHQTDPADRIAKATDILSTAETGTVVILVNPNNPDGAMFAPDDIFKLGKLADARSCWLVVDEAFMDCQPDQSVCSQIDQLQNTVVLRSFGKFFGLAGARLGCAVMDCNLATDLESRIGPWAIPGPTMVVGAQAFSDTHWQQQSRTRLTADAARLDDLITKNSRLALSGGTDLFRYYDGKDCVALADHLGHRGILVRLFDHDANKVRLGLPGTGIDWKRIEDAMADWLNANR